MSNDYFSAATRLARHTLARSATVNAIQDAIKAGFDLLPGKDALNEDRVTFAPGTGTANAYRAALPKTLTAYTTGLAVRISIPATNTGASTLNVDTLGARAIRRTDGTDVEAGDLAEGDVLDLVYNGNTFVMVPTPRSHMAGIANKLGANLTFTGTTSFAKIIGNAVQSGAADTTAGRLMASGAFGLGNTGASALNLDNLNSHDTPAGFYTVTDSTTGTRPSGGSTFAFLIVFRQALTGLCQVWVNANNSGLYWRTASSGTWGAWRTVRGSDNTTIDGNGFVKQASPIVRIHADRVEEPNEPVGASMSHPAVGHYVIAATPPLATQGWRYQAPDGMEMDPPVWTEAGLNVRLYSDNRPADIPDGAFAMLRFWEGDGPAPDAPRVSDAEEVAIALDNARARMGVGALAWGRALRITPHGDGSLDAAVKAELAAATEEEREDYERVSRFERNRPEIARFLQDETGINLSDEAIDDLFRLAMSIEAAP